MSGLKKKNTIGKEEAPANGQAEIRGELKEALATKSAAAGKDYKTIDDVPYTKGEWFYYGLQQIGGKAFIIGATAALGWLARYGKPWYGPVPNVFKMVNDKFHEAFFHEKSGLLIHQSETVQRLGHAVVGTNVLMWGGTLFSPFMMWLENNREKIANWYNGKHGTPEDVAITHERLKDDPKQNGWDILKGRAVAWGTVFTAMVAADLVMGKGKLFGKGDPTKYRFDQYEEAFGRWLAGFSKKGKELWATPLSKELTEPQKQNGLYQFGRITALDFFATNAAIIVWSIASRTSAKKRQEREKSGNSLAETTDALLYPVHTGPHPHAADVPAPEKTGKRHSEGMTPRHPASIEPRPENFTEGVNLEKTIEPQPGVRL